MPLSHGESISGITPTSKDLTNFASFSFVHGNTFGKFTSIFSKENIFTDIVKTSLFKNHTYTLQKYFDDFDKNELFFTNPTSKIIKFSIEDKNFELKPHCSVLVEIQNEI